MAYELFLDLLRALRNLLIWHDGPGLCWSRLGACIGLGTGEQVPTFAAAVVCQRALAVAELSIALHLFHRVLHASLGCGPLRRARRDLSSRTSSYCPLRHLYGLLP